MNVVVMGIDHSTPIEIREKASYTSEKFQRACEYLAGQDVIKEFIILSTCNRSEIYCCTEEASLLPKILFDFFVNFHGIDRVHLNKYGYLESGERAVLHLLNVASGLKSLVIGEDQILGQIKAAHRTAMHRKSTGPILNRLFFTAVSAAKEVKNITGISQNSLSISSVGVKFIEEYFGGKIQHKKVLVIGTGKMGRLAVKKLISAGVHDIIMTNRTHHHAVEFQKEIKGTKIISYDERYHHLDDIDVVISSTSSPHYTLTYDKFCMARNSGKELCILDLAVPRDIEKEIGNLQGVHLFTIDDLDKVVQQNLQKRFEHSKEAQNILQKYCCEFLEWINAYDRLESIRAIHVYGKGVLERQYHYAIRKLNIKDEREKKIIYKILKNSIDAVINPIIESAREQEQNMSWDEFIKKSFEK